MSQLLFIPHVSITMLVENFRQGVPNLSRWLHYCHMMSSHLLAVAVKVEHIPDNGPEAVIGEHLQQ